MDKKDSYLLQFGVDLEKNHSLYTNDNAKKETLY